jgi:hypothetical protein
MRRIVWLTGAIALLACGDGSTVGPDPNARPLADRADEVSGNQLHFFYVVASDGTDREFDRNGTLASSIGSFQAWMVARTGGRRFRVDTFGGAADITFLRLSRTNAQMASYGVFARDSLEKDVALAGFASPNKIYPFYFDGPNNASCGGGPWPPLLIGRVAALYLQGTPPAAPPCSSTPFALSTTAAPRYLEFAMLHEILHALGIVSAGAPNHTLSGHVRDDNRDLMYAGPLPWLPSELDVGGNDYFGANVPAGVINLANSSWLVP